LIRLYEQAKGRELLLARERAIREAEERPTQAEVLYVPGL
jgi:hypothetical protein